MRVGEIIWNVYVNDAPVLVDPVTRRIVYVFR